MACQVTALIHTQLIGYKNSPKMSLAVMFAAVSNYISTCFPPFIIYSNLRVLNVGLHDAGLVSYVVYSLLVCERFIGSP